MCALQVFIIIIIIIKIPLIAGRKYWQCCRDCKCGFTDNVKPTHFAIHQADEGGLSSHLVAFGTLPDRIYLGKTYSCHS